MKRKFPQRMKHGSCSVTIYRTPSKGYSIFTISYYDGNGTRCRHTFSKYERAREPAREAVSKLATGEREVRVLSGRELIIYQRAMRAVYPTGCSAGSSPLHKSLEVRKQHPALIQVRKQPL